MSRQDDVNVGNSAKYKAKRYSAASAGYKSAVKSAKNLLAVENSHDNLVQALDEYIEFLTETGNSSASFAYMYGWRCPRHDIAKGVQLRAEITKLRKAL